MSNPTATSVDEPRSDYDRIGGAPAVGAVVNRFYDLVLADPYLSPFFDGVDMARVKRHQVLMISHILGGPVAYDGPDLRTAHSGLRIGPDHFGRVGGHLIAVLRDAGVDADIIGRVQAAVGAVEPDIVTAPAG